MKNSKAMKQNEMKINRERDETKQKTEKKARPIEKAH